MKKIAHLAETLLFLIFIGAFFVLNLALPDRSFSEQENRMLQTAPRFSFSALFEGKFTTDFESYVTDQFALRDRWTALKARSELISGKAENKGIYLCENETLIEPYTAPVQNDLDFSLDAINTLSETAGVPVAFALIPSASEIWAEKLPEGAPNDSQKVTIDYAYNYLTAQTADIYAALSAHANEPIFYRTDHHWTTLGAYYGYTALGETLGFTPQPLTDFSARIVSDDFYGTAYSASGFSWISPDSITRYVDAPDAVVTNFPRGEAVPGTLYDESRLSVKDKYTYFLGGNSPLITVETGVADAPTLLILRDSYMDSLTPYLLAHFSEIHILDLRYFGTSVHEYIAGNDVDQVLVCYNVKNFTTDGNIFRAAY